MKENVKEWYHANYPDDDIWKDINPNSTFSSVLLALVNHTNIYNVICGDSIVREKVFEKLADLLGFDYGTIYSMWENS